MTTNKLTDPFKYVHLDDDVLHHVRAKFADINFLTVCSNFVAPQ
jgi:hypothetical protein